MNIHGHGGWFSMVAAATLATGLLATGCKNVSEPEPDTPLVISFTPATRVQQTVAGQGILFAMHTDRAATASVTWCLDGAVVGTAREYTYRRTQAGRDTLQAWAVAGEVTKDWFWIIDTTPEPSSAPPPVPNIKAVAGADPVQVDLTWDRIAASGWPMVDYVVKISCSGSITEAGWDALPVAAVATHVPGVEIYRATFGAADGLQAGATARFAVRGRDDHGQLSPIVANAATVVTRAWWVEGRVIDECGLPLAGVAVSSALPMRDGSTNDAGWYRLGPYRSIDATRVRASFGEHFGFTSVSLADSFDVRQDIVLPYRYEIDAACLTYRGSFLDYVRDMTHTTPVAGDASATRLWKWPSYPVKVFLPDSTLAGGRRMDDLVRPMLTIWNDAIGEPMLVEVGTLAEADVHFRWVDDAAAGYGQTALESPVDGSLGDVIPRRMRVDVETGILADQFFQEVSLHELGHVLGLVDHYDPSCPVSGHLLVFGASGNLSLAEPIHVDEVRAMRFVLRAPQGVDMAGYDR